MYAMQIQTGELRDTDLPSAYGEWRDYARFAVTFSPQDREPRQSFERTTDCRGDGSC